MGTYGIYGESGEYDSPYLVQVNENGSYRYVWENMESQWYPKLADYYYKIIEKGTWLELAELPEKPWKW